MEIQQLYTQCLAQGAYFIESNGEAAVIDPLRETQQYIDLARERGATIKYIFETHFHADFVSGHVSLAQKTGAPIVYGPNANPAFDFHAAQDGETFSLGDLTIELLHTPGHTLESSCYLLKKDGEPQAIFTGDTLFLGDVGRPDLAQEMGKLTQNDLAGMLYDSLRSKIMSLPDNLIIYPGHGAGSACGKNMSKETVGTLGEQKESNYALRQDMTKQEFIEELTDGLLAPPAYFPENVRMNQQGYQDVDLLLKTNNKALSAAEVEQLQMKGAVVLDVRKATEFTAAHIPDSIFVGLDGQFAPWVGTVLEKVDQPLVLVVDRERVEEAMLRLSRVGFDQVFGYLEGGIDAWRHAGKEVATITDISADEFADRMLAQPDLPVLDVRKIGEFEAGHVVGAQHIPLEETPKHVGELPQGELMVHCAGGYRSVIALSLLKRKGYHKGINVLGGFGAIKLTNAPLENCCAKAN